MPAPRFLTLPCGRLFTTLSGLALAAAGALAIAAPGEHTNVYLALVVLFTVTGSIIATGLATQHFNEQVVALLLTLPFVAGVYFASLTRILGRGVGFGAPLIAIGALALWFALSGYRRLLRPSQA